MKVDKEKILQTVGIIVLAVLVLSAVFMSCGSQKKSSNFNLRKDFSTATARLATKEAKMADVSYEYEVAEDEAAVTYGNNGAVTDRGQAEFSKKIIKNGSINLEVESLSETMVAIQNWVKDFGGYISQTNEYSTYIFVSVKIPSDSFDDAINSTGDFGKLIYKNISSQDVTEQYYDLQTRLSTKRTLLKKLEGYLASAKTIEEIISVEEKISNVTSELENMQTRMNRLSQQIDFSEITLTANLPKNQSESGFILPDTKNAFREFVGNILKFFVNFFIGILGIAVYGVPCVLLLFFLYWLCFGKLGLLKKLFKKLK